MKHSVKFLIVTLLTILCINSTKAQFGISFGGNISNVMHRNLLVNENGDSNTKPIFGYLSGMNFQFYPFKHQQNMSFTIEVLYNQKGYKQQFNDTSFTKRLNYISVPLLFNYDISKKFTLNTGVTFSGLLVPLSVFYKPDNSFNTSDINLSIGAEYKVWKNLNLFTRLNYGVYPILNYYKIDEAGNISPTNDVRNLSFSVGLKLNFIYEKIKFF